MKKCKNILLIPSLGQRDGYAYIQLLTVAIGESLGDCIQRGRGRDGRGYSDKYITHKHQGKGFLFSHFGKPYSM